MVKFKVKMVVKPIAREVQYLSGQPLGAPSDDKKRVLY
jgi:hypothetical protein